MSAVTLHVTPKRKFKAIPHTIAFRLSHKHIRKGAKALKKYLPAKRAMLTFYLLLAAAGTALDFILYRYVTMLPTEILQLISMLLWALILLVALIVIPHYFIYSKTVITKNEIATAGGFFTYKNDYMPISSVKSVSVIVTPFGGLTGFNFVIINALGAKLIICFLRKKDVMMISKDISEMILSREN